MKGSGELGTLPHAKIIKCVEFLTSAEFMQHVAFGTRHVKLSDGSSIEVSATERTRAPAELWKLYRERFVESERVQRTQFFELAGTT